MIGVVGILIIAATTGIVTWWAYHVDKLERAEQAAAYKEAYEKLQGEA